MIAVLLVCAAKILYFLGFGLFKAAAPAMKRLSANRPFEVAGQVLTDGRWLLGLLLTLGGMVAESAALAVLPLAAALPIAGLGLVFLLAVAAFVFGERLGSYEWVALAVIAVGMGMLVLSVSPSLSHPAADAPRPGTVAGLPDWKVALFVAPSLLLPFGLFIGKDSLVGGRHARRLTGISYGIGAGVLLGGALVSGMGVAAVVRGHHAAVLTTPYPWLVLLLGGLGLGLLQIALQRCRLGIVVTVATLSAEIYRLLVGRLAFRMTWPHTVPAIALQAGGLLLAALALAVFPRHEEDERYEGRHAVGDFVSQARIPGPRALSR